jgi:hypothetical protein
MDRSESDVSPDPNVAESRDTGGLEPDEHTEAQRRVEPDAGSTTGVEDNDKFVGRAAGEDAGYSGQTGAEARGDAEEDR